MSVINIDNYNSVDSIYSSIDEAVDWVQKAKQDLTNSQNAIPSVIKGNLKGLYSDIISDFGIIEQQCVHTKDGIQSNIQNYLNQEQLTDNSSLDESLLLNGNVVAGVPTRAGSSFFAGLSNGTFDKETGVYAISDSKSNLEYSYNVENGRLKVYKAGNLVSDSYVGVYYPDNYKDLSFLNTITFLPGDGEHLDGVWGYKLDQKYEKSVYENIQGLLSNETAAIVIIPQTSSGNDGYIEVGESVTYDTQFVQTFTNQNSECENSIVGVSSGGYSSFHIAANSGSDIYDKVVCVNGYMRHGDMRHAIQSSEVANLVDKEIIIMQSDEDKLLDKSLSSIEFMHDNNFQNVTIVTNSNEMYSKVRGYGFNSRYSSNSNWKGHTAMWEMIGETGVMEYLGTHNR